MLVRGKRGMELEMLAWWLLGLLLFVIIVLGIIIVFKGKGAGMIGYIKNFFKR